MTSTTAFAKGQFGQSPEFEEGLDRLAEVAVRAGLGLAPGQELVMTVTLDAVPQRHCMKPIFNSVSIRARSIWLTICSQRKSPGEASPAKVLALNCVKGRRAHDRRPSQRGQYVGGVAIALPGTLQ
jgi:hypothetical protein